jgi:Sec-independent protein translocase protein TatA
MGMKTYIGVGAVVLFGYMTYRMFQQEREVGMLLRELLQVAGNDGEEQQELHQHQQQQMQQSRNPFHSHPMQRRPMSQPQPQLQQQQQQQYPQEQAFQPVVHAVRQRAFTDDSGEDSRLVNNLAEMRSQMEQRRQDPNWRQKLSSSSTLDTEPPQQQQQQPGSGFVEVRMDKRRLNKNGNRIR